MGKARRADVPATHSAPIANAALVGTPAYGEAVTLFAADRHSHPIHMTRLLRGPGGRC